MNWLKKIFGIKKDVEYESEADLERVKWTRKDSSQVDKDMPKWLVKFFEENKMKKEIAKFKI